MDSLDYRFGQERIGPGDPDTRPCVARITAKAAGEFMCEEPYVQRESIPAPVVASPEVRGGRSVHIDAPYRRRVRMGIDT